MSCYARTHMRNPCALVTGASRGIGREIAIGLASLGFDLVLNYARNVEAAQQTAEACRASGRTAGFEIRTFPIQADLSSSVARTSLITQARERLSTLELLVNNAGIAPAQRADILDASEESFDSLIHTNLKAPYFLTQAAARWMLEASPRPAPSLSSDDRFLPKIITISSISAYTASTTRGDYCISKAGLSMVTALFAERLASEGILVYEIRPGVIATDMTAGVRGKYDKLIADGLTPIRRWGTPNDVSKAVRAIASGALPFSTGEVINVDGGFHLRRL